MKTSFRYILSPYHFLLIIFMIASCQTPSDVPYQNDALASAHPLATEAGNSIYQKGGNAFDAAVAAGFALAVVEPSMSGLGGRLQALYHTAAGELKGVDATTAVPAAYVQTEERFRYGYETIGIPGVVAGLIKLHQEGGLLPLKTVMQPAIDLAEQGFELLPGEAQRQAMARDQLLEFDGSRQYFLDENQASRLAGNQWIQKDLANTLQRIADLGHAGFYEGETAQRMVEDIQSKGGILSLEDLKNYRALTSKVLQGSYHGIDIYGLYLPSFGAISIQILQLMEALESQETLGDHWPYMIGLATAKAYSYRSHQTHEDSLRVILSKDKANQWAKSILQETPQTVLLPEQLPESWVAAMGHTTHLTSADRWGNIVSLTQTIGPNMGSKVATPGLGFLYAVTLGGYLGNYKPGDRATSHISPIIVLKDKKPLLALGAAGGSRIPPAVTQTFHRYFRQQISLEDALAAPRVYPDADTLLLEAHPGLLWKPAEIEFLDKKGQAYKRIESPARFGRVHGIALDTLTNKWKAAADPDWEGTAKD